MNTSSPKQTEPQMTIDSGKVKSADSGDLEAVQNESPVDIKSACLETGTNVNESVKSCVNLKFGIVEILNLAECDKDNNVDNEAKAASGVAGGSSVLAEGVPSVSVGEMTEKEQSVSIATGDVSSETVRTINVTKGKGDATIQTRGESRKTDKTANVMEEKPSRLGVTQSNSLASETSNLLTEAAVVSVGTPGSKILSSNMNVKHPERVDVNFNDYLPESPCRAHLIDFDSKLPCNPDPLNPMLKNLVSSPPYRKVLSSFNRPAHSVANVKNVKTLQGTITTPSFQRNDAFGQLGLQCDAEKKNSPAAVSYPNGIKSGNVCKKKVQLYSNSQALDAISGNQAAIPKTRSYNAKSENNDMNMSLEQTNVISENSEFGYGGFEDPDLKHPNLKEETLCAVKVDIDNALDSSKCISSNSGNYGEIIQNNDVEQTNSTLSEHSSLCETHGYYTTSCQGWTPCSDGATNLQCKNYMPSNLFISQNMFSSSSVLSRVEEVPSQKQCNFGSFNSCQVPPIVSSIRVDPRLLNDCTLSYAFDPFIPSQENQENMTDIVIDMEQRHKSAFSHHNGMDVQFEAGEGTQSNEMTNYSIAKMTSGQYTSYMADDCNDKVTESDMIEDSTYSNANDLSDCSIYEIREVMNANNETSEVIDARNVICGVINHSYNETDNNFNHTINETNEQKTCADNVAESKDYKEINNKLEDTPEPSISSFTSPSVDQHDQQTRNGTLSLVNIVKDENRQEQAIEIKYCECADSEPGTDVPVEQVFILGGQMYQLPDANIVCIGKFEFYAFLKDGVFYVPVSSFYHVVGEGERNVFLDVVNEKRLKVHKLSSDEICLLEQKCSVYFDSSNKDLVDIFALQEACLELLRLNPDNITLQMLGCSTPYQRELGSQMRCSKCGHSKRGQIRDKTYIPVTQTGKKTARVTATLGKLKLGGEEFTSFELSGKTFFSFKDIVKQKVMSLTCLLKRMKKINSKAIRAPKEIEDFFFFQSCFVDHTLWVDTASLRCLVCMTSYKKLNSKLLSSIARGEYSYDPYYHLLCEDTSKLETVFKICPKKLTVQEELLANKLKDTEIPFILSGQKRKLAKSSCSAIDSTTNKSSQNNEMVKAVLKETRENDVQVAEVATKMDAMCSQGTNEDYRKKKVNEIINSESTGENKKFLRKLRPRNKKNSLVIENDDKIDVKSNKRRRKKRKSIKKGQTCKSSEPHITLDVGDYLVSDLDEFCRKLNAGLIDMKETGFVEPKDEVKEAIAAVKSIKDCFKSEAFEIHSVVKGDSNVPNHTIELTGIRSSSIEQDLNHSKLKTKNFESNRFSSSEQDFESSVAIEVMLKDKFASGDEEEKEVCVENKNMNIHEYIGLQDLENVVNDVKVSSINVQDRVNQSVLVKTYTTEECDITTNDKDKRNDGTSVEMSPDNGKSRSYNTKENENSGKDEHFYGIYVEDISADAPKLHATELCKRYNEKDADQALSVKEVCQVSDNSTSRKEESIEEDCERNQVNSPEKSSKSHKLVISPQTSLYELDKSIDRDIKRHDKNQVGEIRDTNAARMTSDLEKTQMETQNKIIDEKNQHTEEYQNESLNKIHGEVESELFKDGKQTKDHEGVKPQIEKHVSLDGREAEKNKAPKSHTQVSSSTCTNTLSNNEKRIQMETNIKRYMVFMYVKDGPNPGFRVKKFQEGAEKIFPDLFLPDPEDPVTKSKRVEFQIAAAKYLDDLFYQHKLKALERKQEKKTNIVQPNYTRGEEAVRNEFSAMDGKTEKSNDATNETSVDLEAKPRCHSLNEAKEVVCLTETNEKDHNGVSDSHNSDTNVAILAEKDQKLDTASEDIAWEEASNVKRLSVKDKSGSLLSSKDLNNNLEFKTEGKEEKRTEKKGGCFKDMRSKRLNITPKDIDQNFDTPSLTNGDKLKRISKRIKEKEKHKAGSRNEDKQRQIKTDENNNKSVSVNTNKKKRKHADSEKDSFIMIKEKEKPKAGSSNEDKQRNIKTEENNNESVSVYTCQKRRKHADSEIGSLIMTIRRKRQCNTFKGNKQDLTDCFVQLKRIKLLDDAVLF